MLRFHAPLPCLLASTLALSGCAVVGHVTQLDDDYYRVVRLQTADSMLPNCRPSSTCSSTPTRCS